RWPGAAARPGSWARPACPGTNTAAPAASRERGLSYARSMPDLDALARELDEALLARREIPSLTRTHGDFDLASAYGIQQRGIALRQKRGEEIVGYKMGLTSAAKRVQMSLDLPIYGVLTSAMRIEGEL